MKTWWNQKAIPWLKKYGPWIIFPLGVLLVVAKVLGGRKTTVVSSELLGAAEVSNEASAEEARKAAESKRELEEVLAKVDAEHAAAIDEQIEGINAQVDELLDSPDDLNKHLLDAGKKMRE